MATLITAQLLYLESENPKKDIFMYINSPGGVVTAGMAIHDTMQYIRPRVGTVCIGQAASMGASCSRRRAGHAGGAHQRPDHDPPAVGRRAGHGLRHRDPGQGDPAHPAPDERALCQYTGQPLETIEKAMDRDKFLSSTRRKEFGIVDEVFDKRPPADGTRRRRPASGQSRPAVDFRPRLALHVPHIMFGGDFASAGTKKRRTLPSFRPSLPGAGGRGVNQ
jgi:ATP-dependent Clp protease protease subunit